MDHLWSTLSNGEIVSFDPLNDRLVFDDPAMSAADVEFLFDLGVAGYFGHAGKTVTVACEPEAFTSLNIVFADGSLFKVGDDSTSLSPDAAPNSLTGASGDDQLAGLNGDDTLSGGAGNDVLLG